LTEYFSDPAERDAWCNKTKAKLVERANGTFLWAGFAIKQLITTRPPYVEEMLKKLPKRLDALYDRILVQIEETHKETQQKQITTLIRWVMVAARPMSLAEMSSIIPIEKREGFRNDTIIKGLVADCKGLLVIADETVSLMHQSVKDFLVAQDSSASASRNLFCVKENLAHEEVARTCISYLQCGSLANGPVLEREFAHIVPAREVSFPLLSYSILNWPTHARLSEQDIFDDKDPFFTKFSTAREAWLNANWLLTRCHNPPKKFSLLHIAAYFNLPALVKRLVKSH
jgi:hypothetical protein